MSSIARAWIALARILLLLTASLACAGGAWPQDRLADAQILAAPATLRPSYLEPVKDPVFGTQFTRIIDPGWTTLPGARCSPDYCTHRYSTSQAWNADQTLLVIVNGCRGGCFLFLDGQTYKPLFLRIVPNECEWHPTNPALMICVNGNEIYAWAPRTDAKTTIYTDPAYRHFQFGPYKGNPSYDGNRLVVRARDSKGALVAFAYDISTRTKFPAIELAELTGVNGYCTISPSGKYIFCSQTMPDQTNQEYVFTVSGEQVQHWTENHRPGHGDMTIDADGSDVYVGISKAPPDEYHVIKRRLSDGVVTDLAPYGEGQHASMRSIRRPGWVFLTYSGTYAEIARHSKWAPFYLEVIALRIDGSGEIRRIAQTHLAKSDYWSEPHASPSPDGSQVIWSSNWGNKGGPVADYVTRVQWPEPATGKASASVAEPGPKSANTPG